MRLRIAPFAWLKCQPGWRRLAVAGYAILLTLFAFLWPLLTIFHQPDSPYHAAVVHFIDETCGGAPANREASGIYTNSTHETPPQWNIAVYNGRCRHRLFFGLGGDHFRHAALDAQYTHRINAESPGAALDFLKTLLGSKPATVELVDIAILDHGSPGAPRFASQLIANDFYEALDKLNLPSLTLRFYGCSIANGEKGERFINTLSSRYNFTVMASRAPVTFRSQWFRRAMPSVAEKDWVRSVKMQP